jgi:hypothetical protein
MVTHTTSGICVIGRSIFMFGGSTGSPNSNDTYKYDLGTATLRSAPPPAHLLRFASPYGGPKLTHGVYLSVVADARQWTKLSVGGELPLPSNYSKLTAWGSHVVRSRPALSDA